MICVIDETAPEVNGSVIYVIVSAVLLETESCARAQLQAVIGRRSRPFHWNREGERKRLAMAQAAESIGALARGFEQACGRKTQDAARAQLLATALEWAVANGAEQIIIERRSKVQDQRDTATVKRTLRRLGVPIDRPIVRWRGKSEPLLWIADAIAGVAHERYYPPINGAASKQLATAVDFDISYVPKE